MQTPERWLIPVAVERLDEGIVGEEAALQEEIERSLIALGMPATRTMR
jgi:hypothetical protein